MLTQFLFNLVYHDNFIVNYQIYIPMQPIDLIIILLDIPLSKTDWKWHVQTQWQVFILLSDFLTQLCGRPMENQ